MTLGEDWYREFWERFQPYVSAHYPQWSGTETDKKWSRFVFDFLTSMSRELRYQEQEEAPAFRSRRFDRVWRREGDTVVLEHENEHVKHALDDEVRKLAQRKGDLHICITYLPESEFPGDEYADKCKSRLDEEQFDGEFLLVLGTNEMRNPTDWVCHRISSETSLEREKIVLPSTVSASKWETQRRQRSSSNRSESGWEIMKRQMPNSKAVEKRLRRAIRMGRGENYIRSLRSLKRYWEKQGK